MIILACKLCGSTRVNISDTNELKCNDCNKEFRLSGFSYVELYGENTIIPSKSEKVIKDEICPKSEEISKNKV